MRFKYNQDFVSVYAMVPSSMALLLALFPAILMALAIVREKELGSITNLYVTPVTRIEFLLGKQLPYIAVAMTNFLMMFVMALLVFQVPLKGSFVALLLGALLYVTATTAYGMLISAFTSTQIAALFGTAILTRPAGDAVLRDDDPGIVARRHRGGHGSLLPDELFSADQRRNLYQRARPAGLDHKSDRARSVCSGADHDEPAAPA